ncbi:DUF4124 domain-containing protein [Duganella sp. LX20W]|uniref:DUF4124 domain-containing protein n=1 Tax=Rugamonas brunnea TaxID=2758569 RepID=A0A7W2IB35_9BURK|nr:DUF4124 domain-containing protein [Rugamonas brunnea]MBA5636522.1 DUF4124 domain-containing protein [Rugamonas brunnea]
MTTRLLTVLVLLAASAAARADGPIYLCVDAAGHKELTDANKPGCRLLDVPGNAAIPAPPRRPAGAPQRAAPAAAPADFPRVDSAEQRARDADRLGILNEELRNEQQKLADLRKEFNNGEPERHGDERNYAKYQERVAQMRDSISRSEKNIEALKREIATIR